jgi:hypothetical protein
MGKDDSKLTLKLPEKQQQELRRQRKEVERWRKQEDHQWQGEALKLWTEIEAETATTTTEIERARRVIDRVNAIRDGLIAPTWAEKPLLDKAAQKSKSKSKQGDDWQLERIREVLPSLPNILPDGRVLAKLTNKEVAKLLEPEFKKRGWKFPSPDSVRRVRGPRRRPRRVR